MRKNSQLEKLLTKYFEDFQKISYKHHTDFTDFNAEESFSKIQLSIKKDKKIIPLWFKIAASVIVVCGAVFLFNNTLTRESLNLIVKTTGVGDKKEILLPDGSKVWLNAQSELKYDQNFNKKNREISLTGEAYFEVKRNTNKPFIICSQNIRTTVLGTTFNIKAYDNDNDIAVSVVNGKVAVEENNTKLILTKNQLALYDKNTQKLEFSALYDVTNNTSWKDGRLKFNSEPLDKVAKVIQRNFETNIHLSDKVKDCLISADFTDMPLKKIIKIIEEIINSKTTFKDNTYYLTGRGCNN